MNNLCYGILCFLLTNWTFMAVYCRVERKIDNQKFLREDSFMQSNNETKKGGVVKRLYHWINAYLYGWVRYNVLIVGHIPSYTIRKLFYMIVFAMKIKKETIIFGGCEFRSPWNITIGNSTIGANCILDGRGRIVIENDVVFGSGVHIWTEEHSVNDPYFRVLRENLQPVIIKRHAWICSDTTILPGITVNEGAVLASRACAVNNCEAFKIYGGIPAKKIGDRNRELKYELGGKVSWHFM